MKHQEEIGKIYGKLKVLEILPSKNGKIRCSCECSCGNVTEKNLADLKSGNSTTCGKCSIYELIGKRINKLTVLSYQGAGSDGHRMFLCQCDCGNQITVSGTRLKNNKINSCGHCHPQEEIGKKYGKLTVLEYAYSKNQKRYWKCKCECGNTVFVSTSHLHSGHTRSCGCIKSYGEDFIFQLLSSWGVNFKKEYSFSDLVDVKPLHFDFIIFGKKTLAIEFDGEQHFYASAGWGGQEKLQYVKCHDSIKEQYCKTYDIPLLRIKYTWTEGKIVQEIKKFLERNNYEI